MEIAAIQFTTDLTDSQLEIKNTIRDFAEENIRPYIMEYDESQKFPMEIMKKLGDLEKPDHL